LRAAGRAPSAGSGLQRRGSAERLPFRGSASQSGRRAGSGRGLRRAANAQRRPPTFTSSARNPGNMDRVTTYIKNIATIACQRRRQMPTSVGGATNEGASGWASDATRNCAFGGGGWFGQPGVRGSERLGCRCWCSGPDPSVRGPCPLLQGTQQPTKTPTEVCPRTRRRRRNGSPTCMDAPRLSVRP
jgi:hypothetical protein